jgi:hypothetical protein
MHWASMPSSVERWISDQHTGKSENEEENTRSGAKGFGTARVSDPQFSDADDGSGNRSPRTGD